MNTALPPVAKRGGESPRQLVLVTHRGDERIRRVKVSRLRAHRRGGGSDVELSRNSSKERGSLDDKFFFAQAIEARGINRDSRIEVRVEESRANAQRVVTPFERPQGQSGARRKIHIVREVRLKFRAHPVAKS